jgi:hypothetical protein
MSDEPERVFSGARRTISWDKAKLKGDTIERLQCIKHWKKNRIIAKILPTNGDDIVIASDVDRGDDETVEAGEEN